MSADDSMSHDYPDNGLVSGTRGEVSRNQEGKTDAKKPLALHRRIRPGRPRGRQHSPLNHRCLEARSTGVAFQEASCKASEIERLSDV
ncbi:hypothetical protein AVEN_209984-1 [Araneus ventricosus]|uniref:Uncharacterized protein n=1 Tax=Araneus ventricosus TaxID=182803 RepID=A0A4Y2V6D3_ARAVE|nr:hypothetical protein AVEN_209984-1 [Araneus ventricosus]